jgi:DNA helicase-2/ATP-dependent DNA helicase PcrA
MSFTIEKLWEEVGFAPNEEQKRAIKHLSGPLYLTAGPGSGKTRVLLWRTINLVVFQGIDPHEIMLTTFTEKAAFQLKEGLQSYLGMASNHTGIQYDLASMYIGTIHSICQRLMMDRRLSKGRTRRFLPRLLDPLEQYFFVKRQSIWKRLLSAGNIEEIQINSFFQKTEPKFPNKHNAVSDCIALFNRFTEERLDVESALAKTLEKSLLRSLLLMYKEYLLCLKTSKDSEQCDLSLIQEKALEVIEENSMASSVFKHIIVDEYQDTNFIQEQLYFKLSGNKNICVVGDDDQALYRFRGSTVENFVEFPERVKKYLGRDVETTKIPLSVNYRSRKQIVDFYTDFITREDWTKNGNVNSQYRVHDKNIHANSKDDGVAILTTEISDAFWCNSVAKFCKQLVDTSVVKDPNQIAFLFPSLGNQRAQEMITCLKDNGLNVYAPRAGNFLEGDEATELFGVLSHVFDIPSAGSFSGRDFNEYRNWLLRAHGIAQNIIDSDLDLKQFIDAKKIEIERIANDFVSLNKVANKERWELTERFDHDKMSRKLSTANGLSNQARNAILSPYLKRIVAERLNDDKLIPYTLSQIINRATTLDWSLLDLFYQLSGFSHFKNYFDLAENEGNEAPICNLSKITEYITKFMDLYSPMLGASFLEDQKFSKLFFSSFLYTIYRMGEGEFEDENNPFPKGNIPFLTVHQAKGLEFPIVFLYPSRMVGNPGTIETTIRYLKDVDGEPLDRINQFDVMRMFYVGLSRAEKLMIIPNLEPKGHVSKQLMATLNARQVPTVNSCSISELPVINHTKEASLSKPYSYTADYLMYERCPRQYMIFRKYELKPSRTQTMFFGSLVHNTIEDLHHFLIERRTSK